VNFPPAAIEPVDAMTQTEKTVECVACGRTIRDGEEKAAGWFHWSDGDDVHLVCSLCAARGAAPAASVPG
jgi:hypothetical protein